MKLNFLQFNRKRKLEKAITLSVVLFLYKLIFPYNTTFIPLIINEVIVISTFYFIVLYTLEFVENKKYSPLSLILNAGILNAIIFFVLAVVTLGLNTIFEGMTTENFMYSIASTFYSFIFMAATAYIYSVFRTLFFLRQKRNPRFYFNTMVFFLFLTSISNNLVFLNPDVDYIQSAFLVVTILLIAINSIRVPWIAFLVKKEKIYLLVISVVLAVLFSVNIGLSSSANASNKVLLLFSPALYQFVNLLMIYGAIFFGIIFFITLFHLPTAEVFDRKAQEVTSLINLSKLLTQVFDLKELGETVTDMTTQVCNSDSAWLVSGRNGALKLSAVSKIGYLEADKIFTLVNEAYDLRAIKTVKTISLPLEKEANPVNFHSFAIAPLKVYDEINGYLIAARKSEDVFDEDDQKAIGAFADYAAIAIENAKLLEESIEKERLEKELDVAREIQYKIIPENTPRVSGLNISAVFIPAFEVGGDYYDFFELDNERLGFVIADVSGKGISAAFIMAEIKGIFESISRLIDSPREVLHKANDILKNSLNRKSFVTAIYGVIDLKSGVVLLSRAGHTPGLHISGNKIEQIRPDGIGLGLDFTQNFNSSLQEAEIMLKENDILLLFTDGITEAKNSELEDFGVERFENIIMESSGESVDEISNNIMKQVTTFSKGNPQHDDITLVIFKWCKKNNIGEING